MVPSLLLERERELAVISEALERARTGDGTVLLAEGPAAGQRRAGRGLSRPGAQVWTLSGHFTSKTTRARL